MRSVLVDSSAFLSLEDPAERSHGRTRGAFVDLIAEGARLMTTNFVFDESYTLLLTRLGRDRAVGWGASLLASELIQILRVDEDHEARAWEIILSFADKEFSFTDATTFAVAESLEIREALSLDRHFRQYGGLTILP
ncbi:MAG TPA: PIN domain-containing protein [Actinomycetota bacterium]|nr:PIN domain-containing protein [Actinomycetota bacterium]